MKRKRDEDRRGRVCVRKDKCPKKRLFQFHQVPPPEPRERPTPSSAPLPSAAPRVCVCLLVQANKKGPEVFISRCPETQRL